MGRVTIMFAVALQLCVAPGQVAAQDPPDDPRIERWLTRAGQLAERGRSRQAAALAERVLALDPGNLMGALSLAGSTLPQTSTPAIADDPGVGRTARAVVEALQTAQERGAHSADLTSALLWAQALAGDWEQAWASIERVEDGRRLATLAIHRGRLEVAHRALEMAQRSAPGDVEVTRERAVLELARGNPMVAVGMLRHALRLAPGHAGVVEDLAGAQVAAGRPEFALAAYRWLTRHDPQGSRHQMQIARAAFEAGRFGVSVTAARAALAGSDASPDPALLLGAAERARGRRDAARAAYEEALRRGPDNVQARQALRSLEPGGAAP